MKMNRKILIGSGIFLVIVSGFVYLLIMLQINIHYTNRINEFKKKLIEDNSVKANDFLVFTNTLCDEFHSQALDEIKNSYDYDANLATIKKYQDILSHNLGICKVNIFNMNPKIVACSS